MSWPREDASRRRQRDAAWVRCWPGNQLCPPSPLATTACWVLQIYPERVPASTRNPAGHITREEGKGDELYLAWIP